MNQILLKTLTILGFIRKKPKTKIGWVLRYGEYALSVVAILYLLLLVYPQLLFTHTFEHEEARIYSTEPIPHTEAAQLLYKVRSQIRASQLYKEKDVFRIFLCNSKLMYTFFAPLSRRSFASTSISGNIFAANVDWYKNTATAFRSDHNERSFTGVASHEIGHVMIRRHFGLWSAYRAPTWLNEGYCEYISRESSFPEEKGDSLLSQGDEDASQSFSYFAYRRMVEFCLDEKASSITELFASPPPEEQVKRDTRHWLSKKAANNSIRATLNGAPDFRR